MSVSLHCTQLTCLLLPQIMTTLSIVGGLATAMGSACTKYGKVFIPGVMGSLADANVSRLRFS